MDDDDTVRVANEPEGESGGPFAELLKLQTEFQARVAEEGLRFLRRLQGTFGPASPGTVVVPEGDVELAAAGRQGTSVELRLEVENRQRAHCVVTPLLSPLVEASGVTWFPDAESSPPSKLLRPEATGAITLSIPVPAELPSGVYRGVLVLQGFRQAGIPVAVAAGEAAGGRGPSGKAEDRKPKARSGATARTSGGSRGRGTRAGGRKGKS